jgi:hypothetical protein
MSLIQRIAPPQQTNRAPPPEGARLTVWELMVCPHNDRTFSFSQSLWLVCGRYLVGSPVLIVRGVIYFYA